MTQKIGFVGLGAMGLPMATNLLAAGFHLTVYNRTASKAEPLVAKGAHRAARAERLAPDGIHISMSTVSPATTRELVAYHASRGSVMVAAPVFGRPSAAQARQLRICVSGSADARAKVRPILEAMGQEVFEFGDNPGAANVVKLAGNFMIAAALEAMGEAVVMMRKSGVDPAAALEMLAKTIFAAPVYQGYGPMIAHGRFSPAGFRLPLGMKDIDLALQTAVAANA